uniref:NADH-ubiquinone oxidoreductase chain 2 n=1 Tax=Cylindraustralia sp. HS-2014 TaxID=1564207 RepID=A0A0N6WAE4_9ORTH|nr:NADH dehydrogenase subunit 2 [Cylindraustralia sp. HS-2014]
MLFNPKKTLFILFLMLGTIITISSNNWLGVWMGFEINLLSFIPLMSNTKNTLNTETSIKYFIVQALASTILLFTVMMSSNYSLFNLPISMNMIVSSSMLLKAGAAPFHFWFPEVMNGLNWSNCFILMTWQKLAPLMIISYLIKNNMFFITIIILSSIVGGIGGLNQTSLRKIMSYSSINHISWMLTAMLISEMMWNMYFSIYMFLSLIMTMMFSMTKSFFLNQLFSKTYNPIINFLMFLNLLSLGGLPPFLGFMPKWLIVQYMISMNHMFLSITMVFMTLITLYYYIRISFSSLIMSYHYLKWNMVFYNKNTINLIFISWISMIGLLVSSIFIIYN